MKQRDFVPSVVLDYLEEAGAIEAWPEAAAGLLDALVTMNGRTLPFGQFTAVDLSTLARVIAGGNYDTTGPS